MTQKESMILRVCSLRRQIRSTELRPADQKQEQGPKLKESETNRTTLQEKPKKF